MLSAAAAKIYAHVATFSGLCHFNTPESVAAKLDMRPAVVRRHLSVLVADQLIQKSGGFYRARPENHGEPKMPKNQMTSKQIAANDTGVGPTQPGRWITDIDGEIAEIQAFIGTDTDTGAPCLRWIWLGAGKAGPGSLRSQSDLYWDAAWRCAPSPTLGAGAAWSNALTSEWVCLFKPGTFDADELRGADVSARLMKRAS